MRERAGAAGLSISRYLVERALTVELPRSGAGAPPRPVLSEDEQREMHDRIAYVFERVSTDSAGKDGSLLAQLKDRVSLVARSAMLDMVRDGRTRQVAALPVEVFGEKKGTRVAERFVAWARGQRPIA